MNYYRYPIIINSVDFVVAGKLRYGFLTLSSKIMFLRLLWYKLEIHNSQMLDCIYKDNHFWVVIFLILNLSDFNPNQNSGLWWQFRYYGVLKSWTRWDLRLLLDYFLSVFGTLACDRLWIQRNETQKKIIFLQPPLVKCLEQTALIFYAVHVF